MARNGKIARLPWHIRNRLNARLQNGEPGEPLLDWLNGLPEVREVIEVQFGGVPVSKHNLSEWRMGGYEEWLKRDEACDLVRELTEHAGDLNEAAETNEITDCLALMLGAELARSAKALLEVTEDPKERWRRLQELLPQLAQLRRADHRAWRLRIEDEQWEREKERMDKEKWDRKLRAAKDHALAPIWDSMKRGPIAEAFGGGEQGEKIANFILEIENMHIPEYEDRFRSNPSPPEAVAPGRSESHRDELGGGAE